MSTTTKAARGTSQDAGSNPATSTTRRPWTRVLAVVILGGVFAGGVVVGVNSAPDAEQQFLAGITFDYQDGYAGQVLKAGYWSCASLHAGTTRDALVAYGIREGLAGDLYPSDNVPVVVDSAAANLCPSAPLPGLIRP